MGSNLTIIEQNNLVELESTIEKNLHAFYEVGFALMQIRDNKLYREKYGTFEIYCDKKWNLERRRAYQLIDGYKITENVNGSTQKPTSEYQIRPLAKLEPEQQKEVYQRAVETAPEGKVTARHIEETVREMTEVKTEMVGDVIDGEESDALFQLKRWWKKATKKDKSNFKKWMEEK